MAVPATYNLKFVRGDTLTLNITITSDGNTPVNITGRTYRAQIRYERNSSNIAASFTCTPNVTTGVVSCVLSATNSAALTDGAAFWDFEETNAGVVTTILAGKVTILADVTR
jgi:hypothetical protein